MFLVDVFNTIGMSTTYGEAFKCKRLERTSKDNAKIEDECMHFIFDNVGLNVHTVDGHITWDYLYNIKFALYTGTNFLIILVSLSWKQIKAQQQLVFLK